MEYARRSRHDPHISGTSLSAEARYAAGTCDILERYFEGRPIRDEYLIVEGGALAGTGARTHRAPVMEGSGIKT